MSKAKILFVDDDKDFLHSSIRLISTQLSGCTFLSASTPDKAINCFQDEEPNVVVLDLSLTHQDGIESGFSVLENIQSVDQTASIIVLTGNSTTDNGYRAIASGASHFLVKGNHEHLKVLIEEGIRKSTLLRSYQSAFQESSKDSLEKTIVGISPEIERIREEILFAASNPQYVFITGETGTGKSTIARAIHMSGPRKDYSFEVEIPPDAADMSIVQSELFGHVKGAFTGAMNDKKGVIELAHKGTLFLDDIDNLPLKVQGMLLTVLESKEFLPLGATQKRKSDFRLISATNKPIDEALKSGILREDLYFRIAALHIHIPPLRERKEDIPYIAEAICEKVCRKGDLRKIELASDAMKCIKDHYWKGNIRELETVITTAIWMAAYKGKSEVNVDELRITPKQEQDRLEIIGLDAEMHECRQNLIRQALEKNNWNKSKTATELNVSRSRLYEWIKTYQITQ